MLITALNIKIFENNKYSPKFLECWGIWTYGTYCTNQDRKSLMKRNKNVGFDKMLNVKFSNLKTLLFINKFLLCLSLSLMFNIINVFKHHKKSLRFLCWSFQIKLSNNQDFWSITWQTNSMNFIKVFFQHFNKYLWCIKKSINS